VIVFKRVLLCYDGSAAGRRALRRGAELAVLLQSQVFVLSIVPDGSMDPALIAAAAGTTCIADFRTQEFRKLLDESVESLRSRGVSTEGYLTHGNTIDQISDYAKRLDIDLIVLGHYPQATGGFWWARGSRTALADRVRCCIFVANEGLLEKKA
jgi:nucleotide-binding universal stress UspA family protein